MTLNTTYNPTVADGNGTTKEFSYNFNPLAREYLKVSFQINNEWVEQKSGWSATVSENGGVVTFDIAPTTRVAIERNVPEEQPTQYKTSSGFQAEVIEHSFDLLTGMVQELKDETSRSVKVEVGSNISPDEIVSQVERVYDSIDNIDTVGMDIDNVDEVATNISKVNTIANNINDVNTVADNINDVKTVSKNIENVNTVATDIMDVVTVAGITEQTKNVSENMAHVVAVDNNKANIDKAVANATNITTVATSINNINAVAGNKANIDNVASNKTNINNVSANITAVNNVSKNMADVKKAVQSANDAKLWAVGTKTEKPEGSSKYWAEQAKNTVQLPDATETVKGIVRLATSEEVTAGTNDSAAITPLKLKQTIAQDLTNPSADTVPSTKAVSDESSRITTLMNNLLSTLYPVGSIYIGTQNNCPLAALIAGSQWQRVATQVVTNVNTGVAVYGNGKTLGLTNGSQTCGLVTYPKVGFAGDTRNYNKNIGTARAGDLVRENTSYGIVQNGDTSGLTGSLSRTNLSLNIWKRTA